MFFSALAADYDGTLATDGRVDAATIAELVKLRESGRKLILVTGRILDDLSRVFSQLELFDRVVVENGALLYHPQTKEEIILAPIPPPAFIDRLQSLHIEPLSIGRVIVATWTPEDKRVLDAIRDLGFELQITYNKGAVMVLPSGTNKASGLAAALAELELSPRNVVGVGDAENDGAFLDLCGCAVAVANALESVKKSTDWVTTGARGLGVQELTKELIATDLNGRLLRRISNIALGTADDGREATIDWRGKHILLAGTSGGGKSTFITSLIEQICARGLQLVALDPEGEYEGLKEVIAFGDSKTVPSLTGVDQLLIKPDQNAVLNLLAVPFPSRPNFTADVISHLDALRVRSGRPHWIILDEAHHLLPAAWTPAARGLPRNGGLVLVTIEPKMLAPAVVEAMDFILAVGDAPMEVLQQAAAMTHTELSGESQQELEPGHALFWALGSKESPQVIRLAISKQSHQRHRRKYAEGHLGESASFYFRGPERRLNLRAENLHMFLQMAEGVDDETWLHHLQGGDITRWFRDVIKDEELAAEAKSAEDPSIDPVAGRKRIREAIERWYTGPDATFPP